LSILHAVQIVAQDFDTRAIFHRDVEAVFGNQPAQLLEQIALPCVLDRAFN
jgi:hypothetical protein